MSMFQTALFIAEQLLRFAPSLFAEFQTIIANKDITIEELRTRRVAIQNQKFEDLVPHSELPPTVPEM